MTQEQIHPKFMLNHLGTVWERMMAKEHPGGGVGLGVVVAGVAVLDLSDLSF